MDEMEKLKKTVSSGFLIDIGSIIISIVTIILNLTVGSKLELEIRLFFMITNLSLLIPVFSLCNDRRKRLKNINNASIKLSKDILYIKTELNEKNKNENDWKKFLLKAKKIRNWIDLTTKEYYEIYPYNSFYGNQNISPIIENVLNKLYLEELTGYLTNKFLLTKEEINIVLEKLDIFIGKCNTAEEIEEGFVLYIKQEEYENRIKNK